jgi:hypothetical protein
MYHKASDGDDLESVYLSALLSFEMGDYAEVDFLWQYIDIFFSSSLPLLGISTTL